MFNDEHGVDARELTMGGKISTLGTQDANARSDIMQTSLRREGKHPSPWSARFAFMP
jgi:hypothetical protein